MGEEKKVCKKCGVEKPLNEFYFRSDTKTYRSDCKECHLKQKKVYNENNSERRKEYMGEYRIKNPTKYNEWRNNNIEHVLIKVKEWKIKNPVKAKQHKRNNVKKRMMNDPIFKLKTIIRRLINICFDGDKGYSENSKTYKILGISYEGYKKHLQDRFTEGMIWENKGKWEIDHIIPFSTAKTEEEVYRLSHYTNLQPLWREDNNRKSNKLNHGL